MRSAVVVRDVLCVGTGEGKAGRKEFGSVLIVEAERYLNAKWCVIALRIKHESGTSVLGLIEKRTGPQSFRLF